MRLVPVVVLVSLLVAVPARAAAWHPGAAWLAQAQCVHRHEGPWNANTGNGYFGGMQIAPATWLGVKGPSEPQFAHPGNAAFPFTVPMMAQLHVAWLVWLRDGRTWRSWGAVGRGCT